MPRKSTSRAFKRPVRLDMLKPLDIVAVIVVAAIVAAASILTYTGGSGFERIVINGRLGTWIYPLDSEGRVEVEGPLGKTIVSFHDGEVHIEDSPCPTKSCVQMGSISLKGQWLACLPNEVFVRIEGGSDDVDY